ncbi:murein transglycosylase A [Chitinimonas sp. BJB300]|uniref:murein transglycosylase A n=1 Tax=Chitinimonas sp. BJB300 TaxID=1559339 RepID=UPI000C105E5D|nr:murein transglycosylase A [Chitinimonas sp. BJB300]PHV11959.1 transglycosylase [Chitinimonas sp. BJB300]TSJ87277.1 transglycosylase [Chitinimonas sp. BJB300]
MRHFLTFALFLLLLAGCATPPGKSSSCNCSDNTKPAPLTARYNATSWSALPNWPGDNLRDSWPAWLKSCNKLANKAGWKEVCSEARALPTNDDATIRTFFESRFQPYQITTSEGAESGLITGYYEPLLKGSKEASPTRAPIYGVPDDLLLIDLGDNFPAMKGQRLRGRLNGRKVVPYWSRADIEAGKAPTAGLALVWADNPIEAFFLQIQGSGRVQLEDGSLMRVGYADQNGHPYKSIGKWLIDQGQLKPGEASMQGIQAWARANPARLKTLLDSNPSYVFFRQLPNAEGGPIGALNVPLTDGASAAVDPKFVPLGSPIYLATSWPNEEKPLNRLMHAQDTGGAIRGPIRADFFWGYGNEAGQFAGRMKQQGKIWLLWPKGAPLPNTQS